MKFKKIEEALAFCENDEKKEIAALSKLVRGALTVLTAVFAAAMWAVSRRKKAETASLSEEEEMREKELEGAARLRLRLINEKIMSADKKEEGADEMYKLLSNPEFFGSREDFISLIMSEETELRVYGDCLGINRDSIIRMYKTGFGAYYAEASLDWANAGKVAERFIKAVKAGDADMVFRCLSGTDGIEDGDDALRRLHENGNYDRIIQTKADQPDGTARYDGAAGLAAWDPDHFYSRKIASYTLKDGTYYDLSLSCDAEKGYRVDLPGGCGAPAGEQGKGGTSRDDKPAGPREWDPHNIFCFCDPETPIDIRRWSRDFWNKPIADDPGNSNDTP